jgi:hypothetical protein
MELSLPLSLSRAFLGYKFSEYDVTRVGSWRRRFVARQSLQRDFIRFVLKGVP